MSRIILALALYTGAELVKEEAFAYSVVMLVFGIAGEESTAFSRGKRALITGLPFAVVLNLELAMLLDTRPGEAISPIFCTAVIITLWGLALRIHLHWRKSEVNAG